MNNKVVDINKKLVERYIEQNRPPIEIRDQLDIGYMHERNSFEICKIRPIWDRENEFQQLSFAKFKYIKTQKIWKLYWMRASGKWQSYEPFPNSTNLQEILDCVDADAYGCFRG